MLTPTLPESVKDLARSRPCFPRPVRIGPVFKKAGKVSRHQKECVWKRDGVKCRYCGKQLRIPPRGVVSNDDQTATVDHVMSKANGGSNALYNLITACRPCNLAKGSDSALDFRLSTARDPHSIPSNDIGEKL